MTPGEIYLQRSRGLVDAVDAQMPQIRRVADLFAKTILAGRMVHVFASGHSRIMVEEMWPRYGSFPGFNPIVELSLTFHNLVVGANGQRQAMFLENVSRPGRANPPQLRVVSGGQHWSFPPAAAMWFRSKWPSCSARQPFPSWRSSARPILKTVKATIRRGKSSRTLPISSSIPAPARRRDGEDRRPRYPRLPGSTIGGCLLINAIKAEVADRLTKAGRPPKVLSGAAVVGAERARELFESAYDEHARRLARLYENLE